MYDNKNKNKINEKKKKKKKGLEQCEGHAETY